MGMTIDFVVVKLIKLLAAALFDAMQHLFESAVGVVNRWEKKDQTELEKFRVNTDDTNGDLKRRGALKELAVVCEEVTAGKARTAIQLAVEFMKRGGAL